jgi:hypothetical protein
MLEQRGGWFAVNVRGARWRSSSTICSGAAYSGFEPPVTLDDLDWPLD